MTGLFETGELKRGETDRQTVRESTHYVPSLLIPQL